MRFITPSLILVASLILDQVSAHGNFHAAELYDRDVIGYEELYARGFDADGELSARDFDNHEGVYARDYHPNAHDSLVARDLGRRAPPHFPGGRQILGPRESCPMHGPDHCQYHADGRMTVCRFTLRSGNMCSRRCN